jgi:hypothetical protein
LTATRLYAATGSAEAFLFDFTLILSFSGRCNDDRCVGQHRRDITMQGHEVFLDLLAYNRDIIKMDSFTDYNDQLKVTQAYLNRILPSELVLNITQKCVLLVEGNFMLEFL